MGEGIISICGHLLEIRTETKYGLRVGYELPYGLRVVLWIRAHQINNSVHAFVFL